MASHSPSSRGIPGVVLKLMRAKDYTLTVLERTSVTGSFLQLRMRGVELLRNEKWHPTMWVRLWIPIKGGVRQRAYTVVRPHQATGEFFFEFAMHNGPACEWASTVKPGSTIDCTVAGSRFRLPDNQPSQYLMVGDMAALPAINSLLDATKGCPSTVLLEYRNEEDIDVPLRSNPDTRVERFLRDSIDPRNGSTAMLERVEKRLAELPQPVSDVFVWAATDTRTTRALAAMFKSAGFTSQNSFTLAYWWP